MCFMGCIILKCMGTVSWNSAVYVSASFYSVSQLFKERSRIFPFRVDLLLKGVQPPEVTVIFLLCNKGGACVS